MTMKAVVHDKFGDPREVLQIRNVSVPEPRRGEVLVRMLASPINPSDLMSVAGNYSIVPKLPATPGFEGVGIVEQGRGILGKFMVGKKVAVLNRERGNWSEKTVTSAKQVIPIPRLMPEDQAAMSFVNPVTAYVLVRDVLKVPSGAWLVQTAGNSALGKMIIRLGMNFEFKTLSIIRRQEDIEKLKFLGAHEVIVFDIERDRPEMLIEKIRSVTGGGMKYGLDPIGGELGSALIRTLGEQGRMVLYGTLSGEDVHFSSRILMEAGARIEGFWLGKYMQQLGLFKKLSLIKKTSKLILDGTLSTDDTVEFPLDQIHEAVRASVQQGYNKKIILRIADS
ncbi:MAG TPA: zinc-dependent alcohol dehydrogenase family protein [Planctomycetaceae bacterium]|nr:zinc-dependent alcohol dehydrogenase family protein [Planctomycetaceae bacterium]